MKPKPNLEEITSTEAAEIVGVTRRTIDAWGTAGHLPDPIRPGVYPRTSFFKAVCALLQARQGIKAKLDAERLGKLQEERQKLERDRLKDTGEWLEAKVWLAKIDEHIGAIRQGLKSLLLTEQPATLSGRAEADIRELNQKTYTAFCRRMQNSVARLTPTPAKE